MAEVKEKNKKATVAVKSFIDWEDDQIIIIKFLGISYDLYVILKNSWRILVNFNSLYKFYAFLAEKIQYDGILTLISLKNIV